MASLGPTGSYVPNRGTPRVHCKRAAQRLVAGLPKIVPDSPVGARPQLDYPILPDRLAPVSDGALDVDCAIPRARVSIPASAFHCLDLRRFSRAAFPILTGTHAFAH